MKQEDVQELSARPVRNKKCVLSVYLNVDQSQPRNLNRGFEAQLEKLASSLRTFLKERSKCDRLEAAIQRATDFVSSYTPEGRGLALFVDESDGFFSHRKLAFPVTNQIRWDHELFLQPLAHALDELEDYGVVMVDRTKLRVFLVGQGKIDEVLYKEIGERRTRQRKADNQIHANLKEVIRQVEEIVRRKLLHRLVLAGTPETTAELRKLLPARVALSIMGDISIALTASPMEVLSAAQAVANAYELSTEIDNVNDIATSASKKEKAVIGLGHTLEAINSGRVWELVYSAESQTPGFECPDCFALFSVKTSSCAFCNGPVQPVSNVIEHAVGNAHRRGAMVEVITGEAVAALNSAGSIGAFLKNRTKALVAE